MVNPIKECASGIVFARILPQELASQIFEIYV